jgi:hypothetical protein
MCRIIKLTGAIDTITVVELYHLTLTMQCEMV